MFPAIISSFKDVFKKNYRNVFFKTIFLTTVSYIILLSLVYFGISQLSLLSIEWLNTTIEIIGFIAAIVLSLFMLPCVIACLTELFSDEVIKNTERDILPKPPKFKNVPFSESLFLSLGFGLKALIFSLALSCAYLVILPLFLLPLLAFFLAPICSFSFCLVNSFILSRGYYDTIALLHLNTMDRQNIWAKYKLSFITGGFISLFLFSIPLINFIAPVYSFSLMTRLFWRAIGKEGLKIK